MLTRKTVPEAVIIFRSAKGELELVNAHWPKIGVFGMSHIERESYLTVKNEHLDVKLTNARGVYRITGRDKLKGLVVGELVYEEPV